MESEKVVPPTGTETKATDERKTPLWAERVWKIDPDIPADERPHIYEELPLKDESGEELREILRKWGYEEWVTHDNLSGRLMKSRKAQRKYEIFCGGFLYFYDEELKKYPAKIVEEFPKKFPGEEFGEACQKKLEAFFSKLEVYKKHKIFFDWGKDYVRIYINPKPGNPDPPATPAPPPPETST